MADAKALVQNDQLTEAIASFNESLKQNPASYKAYLGKGTALNKLRRYDEALDSFSQAFHIAKDRAKRELIGEVAYKLFIVFYNTERLKDAAKLLNLAQEYGYLANSISIWKHNLKRKVDKVGAEIDLEAKYASLDDVPVKKIHGFAEPVIIEPKVEPNAGPKVETPPKPIEEQKKLLEQKILSKNNLYPVPKNIRCDWFQSSDIVTVSLFVKNLPKDDKLKIKYHKESIGIEFPTSESSEFQYSIGPLFSYIKTAECFHRVFSTKVELYLKKAHDLKWKKLEREENEPVTISDDHIISTSEDKLPSYPSSSKKQVNWNNLKIDGDDDGDDDQKTAGSTEQLFQSLYKDADSDTQRAMMKSYVESNGTVLSMDWKDVGSRKIEVAPPSGMEEKKL